MMNNTIPPWKRLGPRLILIFISLTLIPLGIVGFLAFRNGQQTIEQNLFNHLISANEAKADQFVRWTSENEFELEFLAQRPLVKALAAEVVNCYPDQDACRGAAAQLLENHFLPALKGPSGLAAISLIRASDGVILLSTETEMAGMYRQNEEYFREGLRHTFTDDITYSMSQKAVAMHLGTPILDSSGVPIAVLSAHADLDVMSGFIGYQAGVNQSEDTYLVNSFNFFVTEPRFGNEYALKRSVHTEGVEICLDGNSGIDLYLDYREEPVIGAYKWLPDHAMCILTEIDQAEAYYPIIWLRNRIMGIAALLGIVVSVFAVYFANHISIPISTLQVGADEIGSGNLDYRIGVNREDEIGSLAQSFNHMAANLQQAMQATEYRQKTISALGQAAQAVQLASTTAEIFEIVAKEVGSLGYSAMHFELSEDQTQICIPFMSYRPTAIRDLEKALGFSTQNLTFCVLPDGLYHAMIHNRTALITAAPERYIAEALPPEVQNLSAKIAEALELKQSIFAPLMVSENLAGFLNVSGRGLSKSDVPAVATFANQIAIAIENINSNNQLKQRVQELNITNAVTSIVIQAPDVQTLFAQVVAEVHKFTQGVTTSIFWLNREKNELNLMAHCNVPADVLDAVKIMKVGQGLTGRVAATGQPEFVGHVAEYTGAYQQLVNRDAMHSIAGIPLIGSGGVVGVISLTSSSPAYFTDNRIGLLLSVGHQIAMGIEKMVLLAALKDLNKNLERRVDDRTRALQKSQEATLQMNQDLEDAWKKADAANRSLQQEKLFADQIINSIPGVFYIFDAEGVFMRWNKNLAVVVEYSDAEIAQLHPTELFQGADRDLIADRIHQVFTEGASTAEASFTTKTGRQIPYYFTGYRMVFEGLPILIGTGMDISDLRRTERALYAKAEELERSNQELQQFAYVASHDLQEPLRMVTSYLQLLQRRYTANLDETAHEFMDFAVDGAVRMKALINDLLSFSRVGTRGEAFTRTDFNAVFHQAQENLRFAIQEQNATITCDPLPELNADASQMAQLFQNLIGNAIKFHGAESPLVHVSAQKTTRAWVFSVRDNGIGIAPEYFERIFVIFQRLHTTDEYSGTGIGLAISRRIVERHKGRIWVESQPGAGATFYFSLPDDL